MHAETDVSTDGRYRIRAVERTCDILSILASAGRPVSLADLAKACNVPKGSVYRYLATLEERRFVERVGNESDYRLGVALAGFRVDHLERLTEACRPTLQALRDEFGETTNLGFLIGRQVAYLEIAESPHSTRLAARRHDRDAVHCTALGKAIVSALPDAEVVELLGLTYAPRTKNTLVEWSTLRSDLARTRERGYAVDDEENEVGGRCVAVRLPGDRAAAISISAVSARVPMERLPVLAHRLIESAAAIAAGDRDDRSHGVPSSQI